MTNVSFGNLKKKMSFFKLNNSEKLLCAILEDSDSDDKKREAVRKFTAVFDNDNAFNFAKTNRVAGAVAHYLINYLGQENVSTNWILEHEENFIRISAYVSELDRIADVFKKHDIKLVALKNAGIVRGMEVCPGCCPMGDLDVLIEKKHFKKAHKILIGDGYQFEFRSPLEEVELESAYKSGGTEYWKILPDGQKLWLELQWRTVAGRWLRADQEPSAEELFGRSVPILESVVRLLAPEDNLLQVALHTAKHSYVRAPGFRLHLDVKRIVKQQVINWDVFLKRVLELQVKTPVFFSLAIPNILFNTPIPDYVLKTIQPSYWKVQIISTWLQKISIFNPDEKKFSKLGYIIFTSLLYDDLKCLLRNILPDRQWMQERYKINGKFGLTLGYVRRLHDLVFNHINT